MIYLLPLVSGVLWGLSALFNKGNSDKGINPLNIALIYNIAGFAVSIIILCFTIRSFSTNFISYVYSFMAALLGAGGFWAYFNSIDTTDISLLSMLNRLAVIIAVVGGIFLFSETLNIYQISGLLLVFVGIFSPGIKNLKYIHGKGSLYALLSGVLFGISNLFDKIASKDFSSSVYITLGYALTVIFLVIIVKLTKLKCKKIKEIAKIDFRNILIAGGINAIAFFLMISVYTRGGGVAISNLLSQVRLPIILFGGIVFFKEKEINNIKIFGSVLIIVGTVLLQIK